MLWDQIIILILEGVRVCATQSSSSMAPSSTETLMLILRSLSQVALMKASILGIVWYQPLLTNHDAQGNTPSSRLFWSMETKSLCLNLSLISICHLSHSTVENLYISPCIRLLTTFPSQPVMIGQSISKSYGPPYPHYLRYRVDRVLAEAPLPPVPK